MKVRNKIFLIFLCLLVTILIFIRLNEFIALLSINNNDFRNFHISEYESVWHLRNISNFIIYQSSIIFFYLILLTTTIIRFFNDNKLVIVVNSTLYLLTLLWFIRFYD